MKAVVRDAYGSPDAVELRDLPKPVPAESEVLVRVRAASVNPADWYEAAGRPLVGRPQMGLLSPKDNRLGTDFAGEIEDVGSAVTSFSPGDEVFGARTGAFAEYLTVRSDRAIVRKPPGLTFEEAAAVPIAAITALQGLRDKGGLLEKRRILVNGASGGVGTFAVQIAKALGAEVAAVCSTRNVELVRSLGAGDVIDYTQADFTRGERRYDLLLDIAGGRSFADCRRVLAPDAVVVVVGGPKGNRFLGPLSHVLAMRLGSLRASQAVRLFVAKLNAADLETLRELLERKEVKPVVDRSYPLAETGAALRYLGEGHARGKIVLTV